MKLSSHKSSRIVFDSRRWPVNSNLESPARAFKKLLLKEGFQFNFYFPPPFSKIIRCRLSVGGVLASEFLSG
jgi:hypothetical protein